MMEISKNRSCSLRLAGMLLLGFLCAIVLAPSATADTVYTYTGNPFTDFQSLVNPGQPSGDSCVAGVGECSITLSFTVASPIPANFGFLIAQVTPLSFSMTDGVHTLTQLNATSFIFVGTNQSAQIVAWSIQALTPSFAPIQFVLQTEGPQCQCPGALDNTNTITEVALGSFESTGFAGNFNNPGTWTISTVPHVPEPSSLMLLSAGLLGLTPALRKKR